MVLLPILIWDESNPTGLTTNCLVSLFSLSVSGAVLPTPTTVFGTTLSLTVSPRLRPWDDPVLTVVTIRSTFAVTLL